MLDRRFILENVDLVKQNCTNRGVVVDVDQFVALEQRRKSLQAQVEELNRKANEVSKSIGKAKDPAEREARKEEGRELRENVQRLQADLDRLVVVERGLITDVGPHHELLERGGTYARLHRAQFELSQGGVLE